MGYTTDFRGEFELDEPLTAEQVKIINDFAEERHGGNIDHDPTMPGFWCQWIASDDGKLVYWDGGEKFYEYTAWLEYLVEHFFQPWGRVLNGEVGFRGEDWDDTGTIVVRDNKVSVEVK